MYATLWRFWRHGGEKAFWCFDLLEVVHAVHDGGVHGGKGLLGGFCFARVAQVDARVRFEAPVGVLARPVDASERLLVEDDGEPVLGGNILHEFAAQDVLVGGDVDGGEDGGQLVLGRGDLVVVNADANPNLWRACASSAFAGMAKGHRTEVSSAAW